MHRSGSKPCTLAQRLPVRDGSRRGYAARAVARAQQSGFHLREMPGARRGVPRQPGRAPWHRPCTSLGPARGTETYATRSFRRPLEPIALGRSVGREKSREEHVTMNTSSDAVPDVSLEVFSTCAQSSDGDRESYVRRVADVARWSERVGCKGILVYSDNRLVDPWLVSHVIIQSTTRLCPLVAVQPIYMHPYAVAKMAASFGHLYGRRIYLNMVAGGFKNDLVALNDPTPHDKRYDRLIEYTLIIRELLNGASALSYDGEFYQVKNLKLTPSLPSHLFPGIFVSGSSDAGLAAAKAIGATAVKYPRRPARRSRRTRGWARACGSASSPARTATRHGRRPMSGFPKTARDS